MAASAAKVADCRLMLKQIIGSGDRVTVTKEEMVAPRQSFVMSPALDPTGGGLVAVTTAIGCGTCRIKRRRDSELAKTFSLFVAELEWSSARWCTLLKIGAILSVLLILLDLDPKALLLLLCLLTLQYCGCGAMQERNLAGPCMMAELI